MDQRYKEIPASLGKFRNPRVGGGYKQKMADNVALPGLSSSVSETHGFPGWDGGEARSKMELLNPAGREPCLHVEQNLQPLSPSLLPRLLS